MTSFTESEVEAAALEWLGALGWNVAHGPDIAPDAAGSERFDYTRRSSWRPDSATPWPA